MLTLEINDITLEEHLNIIDSKILIAPDDPKLKFEKSVLLFQLNQFEKSLEVIENITTSWESNWKYLEHKLKIYEKLSIFEPAENCCNLLIEKRPNFLNFLKLGKIQIDLKKNEEAESSLIHCLDRLPKNFEDVDKILKNLEKLSKDNNFLKLKNDLKFFKNDLIKYLDKINLEKEIELFNKEIKSIDKELHLHPTNPKALQRKAYYLNNLEKYSEAIEIYDKLLQLQPNDASLLLSKAYSLRHLGNSSEALEIYDKLLQMNPDDTKVLNNKAYMLSNLGNSSETLEIYDKLLQMNPDDTKVLNNKAHMLSNLGNSSEALEIYDKLLQMNPDDTKVLLSKAYAFSYLKKYSEALEIYDKLLQIHPNDTSLLKNKAYALYFTKQFLLAIQLIEKILDDPAAVDSTFCNLYAQILKKNFSNEDPTNFITSKINSNKYNLSWFMVLIKFQILQNNLSEVIKIYENNPVLLKESVFLTQLGYVYEIQNNPDHAIRYFTLALEQDPLNDWARFSRGQCHIECKLYDLALEDFEIGFNNSRKIHHKESYAYVLDILGKFDESVSILSKYKNSYRRLSVLKVLGLVYRNNRKYDESLDCYSQILQENENDTNGLVGCSLVHESKSQYDLALQFIEKSLEKNGYDEFTMKIKVGILIKMNNFEQAQKDLTLMQQNNSINSNLKIDSNSEYSSYVKSMIKEEWGKIVNTTNPNIIDDRSVEITNLHNLSLVQIFENVESDILEYKSTLRYDLKLKQVNKGLEIEVLKTICAFLNTHGGILIVGYNDDEGIVTGLKNDYGTLGKRKDWDGLQQTLEALIKTSIGTTYSGYIRISREILNDDNQEKELAKIKVIKSSRSAYVKINNSSVFFARRNGQSDSLDAKESYEWIQDHNLI